MKVAMKRGKVKRKSLTSKFILLTTSVAFFILALEVSLRIFYPTAYGFAQGAVVFDPELCYTLAANFSGPIHTLDPPHKTTLTTTPDGARTTGRSDPQIPTVLMLGDSFTLAIQVEDNQTFSSILATTLPANVVNLGVLGYNPYHYLVVLNRTFARYKPQSVVVNFYVSNDFVIPEDDPRRGCEVKVRNGYLVSATQNSTLFTIKMFLHHHSHAYNFIAILLNGSDWMNQFLYLLGVSVNNPTSPETLLFTNTTKGEEYYAETFKVLDEINALTARHHSRLVLAVIPSLYHVVPELWDEFWTRYGTGNPNKEHPFFRLQTYALSRNITIVNLYPFINHSENPWQFYGSRDDHYNGRGHQLHAQRLEAVLK